MKQEEFDKILLKYEAGRRTEKERRRAELRHKNLPSAKEIENPAQSKTQIFENINAGLNLKKKKQGLKLKKKKDGEKRGGGVWRCFLFPPTPFPPPPPPA